MKVWLIGLGLALLCCVHALDDAEDQKIRQAAGTWHMAALATNCKCMLNHKEHMKMTPVTLTPQEGGHITMESSIPMRGGCKKITMTFTRKENGHYFHSCDWGDKTIHDVDTTHEDTMFVKALHEKNGKTCKVWSLLSRDRIIKEEIKNDFIHKAEADGFAENEIKIMPPEVACIESQ